MTARFSYEIVDLIVILKFLQYFVYFKDRKLKVMTERGVKISRYQAFHLILIPIMAIIYFTESLCDSFTDPMLFLILDYSLAEAIYEYAVMVARAIFEFILAVGLLYLFLKMSKRDQPGG